MGERNESGELRNDREELPPRLYEEFEPKELVVCGKCGFLLHEVLLVESAVVYTNGIRVEEEEKKTKVCRYCGLQALREYENEEDIARQKEHMAKRLPLTGEKYI